MRFKRVTKKNLEFITQQLKPDSPITLKKKSKTYVFYDEGIKAVVDQKKAKKRQRFELTKYDPDFSILQALPALDAKRRIELPKEENLEAMMKLMKYDKISEDKSYETYEMKKETIHGIITMLRGMKDFNIKAQFKNYFDLWKDEPEFKSYEMWRIISNASSGALLGAVMPAFWDFGGTMKLAGTLAAMQKIATPLTNVFTSGTMGNVVDKSTIQDDIKDLKNLQKKVGYLYSFIVTDTYLMQPEIIQMSPFPEATLFTLFGIQSVTMAMGKMSLESKSFFAVRDYLIRKNPDLENNEYRDKFYQIIGTSQALTQLAYAASFTPAWLACHANPALIFPVATISAIMLVTSKFYWAFNRCLTNPVTVKSGDYMETDGGIVFDSGFTLKSDEPFVEKKFCGYQMPLRQGIDIVSDYDIQFKKNKNKLEFITEKGSVNINIKDKYDMNKINDKEYSVRLV
ncbi:MAG: hypothetical protein KKA79_08510 [Nanoarchaeota archaeon]|nr:hypothetical protein [Nanoarchaeota archaeon]MCG2717761.1 hypothetical protein [Nanoarchaeota archaeon]